MSDEGQAIPEPPARSFKWILLLVTTVVLLAGTGVGGYWWYSRGQTAVAEVSEDETTEDQTTEDESDGDEATEPSEGDDADAAEAGGVVPLEPFLVNVMGQGSSTFLRAAISLVVGEAEAAETIKENEIERTRLRSAILETLAGQSADRLVTPDGKAELKKLIKERATAVLSDLTVIDVLFTDFVVQY